MKKSVSITYCTQCHWLPRATWMAQELLYTFAQEIDGVSLHPGEGGIFEVRSGNQVIWNRVTDGGFPDIKTLKQRVRDIIAPDKALGHSDKTT